MRPMVEMIGKKFGRWTVVAQATWKAPIQWHCICVCGNAGIVFGGGLRDGSSTSCGCFAKENNKTHGYSNTPTYKTWCAMFQRCTNPNNPSYPRYGGRGINICKRWHKFENFLKDMGERPVGHSIDRIDNDAGYKPSNCRWATNFQQTNNRGGTIYITKDGVTKCLMEWAKTIGVNAKMLRMRIKRGWTGAELFAPCGYKRSLSPAVVTNFKVQQ